MRRHELDWEKTEGCCECSNEYSVYIKCGQFLDSLRTCWLLQTHCAAVHCINRTVQTVRRQKAVPCRTDSSSLLLSDLQLCPSVSIPLSSPLCYVTSNRWRYQCHVPTNIDLLLYTKAVQLLRRPFTPRSSVWPQSLNVGTVMQQQQYQLSAANTPQFYITFRPSFAVLMCFKVLLTLHFSDD